jgi:outer membrane protein assembly factor BamD
MSPGYALDQEYTLKAISQFQRFLEDYPDSDLRSEVEERLGECRRKLAMKEYKTGELYRKMGHPKAAILSYDNVLERYYDSEFADDAYYWKGQCHRKLGELAEADASFTDLIVKYPVSRWASIAQQVLEDVRKKQSQSSTE